MRILAVLAAAAIAAVPATAQVAPRDGRAVVADVRKALAENYVVVERRAALDKVLADGARAGRYDRIPPDELARRINDDLFAVAHDKHLGLSFDPRASNGPSPGPGAGGPPGPAAYEAQARRDNHGVRELRVLPGNIRMMNYTGFHWAGLASARALDHALAFLMEGDAAIIDLRGNGGGSPDAVRHLASYFVPPNTKLVTFHLRSDPPVVSGTGPSPPALGMWPKDKPLYVLTGGRTASAAEEFASHVAGFGFATLVGETTAGAAYRNEIVPIAGGFRLSVSIGRPVLPNGGDWEGKGVAPGLAAPLDQAQARALQDAFARLAATAPADERADYEWLSAAQGALVAPTPLARAADAYAGRYGPREITVDEGGLTYRRDGGIATRLLAVGPDLFALEADPLTRVRFTIENGAVTGFELLSPAGTVATQPKGPAPAG